MASQPTANRPGLPERSVLLRLQRPGRERPVVCRPVAAACPEPVEGFGYSDGVHLLRRIHYQLVFQDPPVVKPDGKPYENTTNDWAYLLQASKAARYLNLVDPAAFVDRRNPDLHIHRLYLGSHDPWVDITGDWRGNFDITLPEFPQLPDFERYRPGRQASAHRPDASPGQELPSASHSYQALGAPQGQLFDRLRTPL
jgi:hypothetical protein